MATLAPIGASLALFALTQSPFALVFAVLGPIVALATLVDSRWQAARHGRVERARFERDVRATREAIVREHDRERLRLARSAPSAGALVHTGRQDRWHGRINEGAVVRLGTGSVPFALISRQEEMPNPSAESSRTARCGQRRRAQLGHDPYRVRESLLAEASLIQDAPIVVDAAPGIVVVGPVAQAVPVLNGLVVQLAHALGPNQATVRLSPHPALRWLHALPHSTAEQESPAPDARAGVDVEFRSRTGDTVIRLAAGEEGAEYGHEFGIIVRVGGGIASAQLRGKDGSELIRLIPEFVSTAQALDCASALSGNSAMSSEPQSGSQAADGVLPTHLDFAQLSQTPAASVGSLECALGMGAQGVQSVDLIADGPHAIVAGTTGSGKSELLICWVLAMASSYPPSAVNFLLVDFKGGASFSPISALPHCVGVVTDLGQEGARRALESLSAELRRRERLLADAGVTSIDVWERARAHGEAGTLGHEGDPPARLVIVVDEFATLASTLPELHELFADVASRGRSLGVHLILCTQRPSGVVRDAVFANCAIRISLRVNNPADSVAVIGTTKAAELSRKSGGCGIVVTDDAGGRTVQFALADQSDIARVVAQWPRHTLERPWCEPLAHTIRFHELCRFHDPAVEHGLAFAVADLPARQSQEVVYYDAERNGSMLILGAHLAGKTGALAALAEAARRRAVHALRWLPAECEGAWDGVEEHLDRIRRGSAEPTLLLLDDVDRVLGALGEELAHSFVDRLGAVMREGGARGVRVAISSTRLSAGVASLAQSCACTLLLRASGMDDHVLGGGDRATFDPRLPAGGGFWFGDRIQVVDAGAPTLPTTPPAPRLSAALLRQAGQTGAEATYTPTLAVVSSAPPAILDRLKSLGSVTVLGASAQTTGAGFRIVLGDPDHWQSEWGLLTELRSTGALAFHLCTPAQFRMFAGSPLTPPPLAQPAETVWLVTQGGRAGRAKLPELDGAPAGGYPSAEASEM